MRGEDISILFGVGTLFVLCLSSLYNYLLFHSLAEIFSIIVACGIFIVAWNSRRFLDNNYLLFIGKLNEGGK
jgi:Membrane-associated sensor domain